MLQTSFNPAAIVVIFHPEVATLLRLIEILSRQVNKTYVVDNTPVDVDSFNLDFRYSNVELIQLGENLGIAAAQNVGIEEARSEGFSHVLLMDQDSEPESDMVKVLFEELCQLEKSKIRVAGVGPQVVNARTGQFKPFSTSGNRLQALRPRGKDAVVYCDYLIASGCLIPSAVLEEVGGMEDALFIDCVDIEWAHRAASKGFVLVGIPKTKIRHIQGAAQWNVLGLSMAKYPPSRHYYFFRNICELFQRSYIDSNWKRNIFFRSLLYALMLSTMRSTRLKNLNIKRDLSRHEVSAGADDVNCM